MTHTEAPASVNWRMKYNGEDVQWTLRDTDEAVLKARFDTFMGNLIDTAAASYDDEQFEQAVKQDFAEEETFKSERFTFAKRTDGKFQLEIYPVLGDGSKPAQYPEVKYTSDRERMWKMIENVTGGYDISDLPVEYPCKWLVTYKLGKETPKGGRYKDLLRIQVA